MTPRIRILSKPVTFQLLVAFLLGALLTAFYHRRTGTTGTLREEREEDSTYVAMCPCDTYKAQINLGTNNIKHTDNSSKTKGIYHYSIICLAKLFFSFLVNKKRDVLPMLSVYPRLIRRRITFIGNKIQQTGDTRY